MVVIGIDPGLTGAIAMIDHTGLKAIEDMPVMERGAGAFCKNQVNAAALGTLLRGWTRDTDKNEIYVVIELARAMPGQGVVSILSIGLTAGLIEGTVVTMGFRHELAPASTWKKAMKLTSNKEECRAAAQRMYPSAELSRVKDHNRAEALLLARYGFDKHF